MAEFQIVAKEIERLCKTYQNKCRTDECPLYLEDLCYAQAMSHIHEYEAGKLEDTVMRWAAEHPVEHPVVYPTWLELAVQQGFKIEEGKQCTDAEQLLILLMASVNTPIPADIAQKLGIEPKEG